MSGNETQAHPSHPADCTLRNPGEMMSTMTKKIPPGDRRKAHSNSGNLGAYTEGIRRLEKIVASALEKHDRMFKDHDKGEWQVLYSLLNHNARVGETAATIATALGWTKYEVDMVRMAGNCHDLGKMDPKCWNYRSIRLFTRSEERRELTLRHQTISGWAVMNFKTHVRQEDRPFLTEVGAIVRNHHNDPLEIPLPRLRVKCLLIRMTDIFITVQEDRGYQPGVSQWSAVEVTEEMVENWRKKPNFTPYIKDAEKIRDAISKLYGPQNIGLT